MGKEATISDNLNGMHFWGELRGNKKTGLARQCSMIVMRTSSPRLYKKCVAAKGWK
jgi:hypothetical protein